MNRIGGGCYSNKINSVQNNDSKEWKVSNQELLEAGYELLTSYLKLTNNKASQVRDKEFIKDNKIQIDLFSQANINFKDLVNSQFNYNNKTVDIVNFVMNSVSKIMSDEKTSLRDLQACQLTSKLIKKDVKSTISKLGVRILKSILAECNNRPWLWDNYKSDKLLNLIKSLQLEAGSILHLSHKLDGIIVGPGKSGSIIELKELSHIDKKSDEALKIQLVNNLLSEISLGFSKDNFQDFASQLKLYLDENDNTYKSLLFIDEDPSGNKCLIQ